ncbi:MAG: hypothetical protein HN377_15025 [Alphaproteobacteria bacterium]|nr:hypothetical protein [Alphaproteobacteria bacterium]
MSMTDTDIRAEVQALLSGSTKKHGKTENRWGTIGLVVGLVGGGIAVQLMDFLFGTGPLLDWIVFLVASVGIFAGVYGIGASINKRRAEKLAQDFHAVFAKDTPECHKALALLQTAKTESGIEKALLTALKADVTFSASAKKSGFLETGEFGFQMGPKKGFENFHSQMDDMVSKMSGGSFSSFNSHSFSASKVPKATFDLMIKSGKLTAVDTMSEDKGVGTTANGGFVYHGDINIMADLKAGKYLTPNAPAASAPAQNPSEQLLGGFDAAAPKQDKPATEQSEQPVSASGFIPLDPYESDGKD